jgi:hypothetical protein
MANTCVRSKTGDEVELFSDLDKNKFWRKTPKMIRKKVRQRRTADEKCDETIDIPTKLITLLITLSETFG